jgi:DNA-directed RNA polymerase specialized sigma subunit
MYAHNEVVESAIREMARELRAFDEQRLAAAAEMLEATIGWLEAELGHSPTAATVAAAVGIGIEELLDLRPPSRPAWPAALLAAA